MDYHLPHEQSATCLVIRTLAIGVITSSLGIHPSGAESPLWDAGPLFDRFALTLDEGERAEALGPLFFTQEQETSSQWALPPFFSTGRAPATDSSDFDLLYPLVTYDRAGGESRFQIFQLFSLAGGRDQQELDARRFTVFPFYFQQRSGVQENDYTAFWPLYGRLKNRLFRSEVEFALWPLYVKTQRRPAASALPDDPFLKTPYRFLSARRGEITTYNYFYPFFHLRYGDGLEGWQFWPLYGSERKSVTSRTNNFGDGETVAGHDKRFILWPFFLDQTVGIGTENAEHQRALLPLFSCLRSPQRDSTTYLWPFGVTVTDDRTRQYREVDAPWPLVVFARGKGKNTSRVWPLYSHASTTNLESGFYLWPLWKYNRVRTEALERERDRVLLFLWSQTTERNRETGSARERTDLWPLFTYKRDFQGNARLQCVAPLEPFLPASKSIQRNYSPLWSVWRAEHNAETGRTSQSLLWNLYRRETSPEAKKCSLLFGLFRYQSDSHGRRYRLFYVPLGGRGSPPDPAASR